MKPANVRKLHKLRRQSLPPAVPDMTGWTSVERLMWHAEHRGLHALVPQPDESDAAAPLPEESDARQALDKALLAERAAKAAREDLARDPASLRAERKVRETREAADKAAKAAEDARRVAEEAKSRPRPPGPTVEPAVEPQALAETPKQEGEPATRAKPKRKRRGPGEPKRKKLWWEERVNLPPPRGAQAQIQAQTEDERRGRPLYETIHEYDPLEAEQDYDPFE